jgi:potassium-transporting ATPase KdpC subunit
MVREFVTGIKTTLVLWLITALVYPLSILAIGQGIFPFQANGSLIKNDRGDLVGSALIGQNFSSDKYFWSRPSAINYSEGKDYEKTGISGASNLAPSNPNLKQQVTERISKLQTTNIEPTPDLIYSSGSGLDPHISIEAARSQIERITTIRNIDRSKLQQLINQNTDNRFLGVFGEPVVNVLQLNLALDEI